MKGVKVLLLLALIVLLGRMAMAYMAEPKIAMDPCFDNRGRFYTVGG